MFLSLSLSLSLSLYRSGWQNGSGEVLQTIHRGTLISQYMSNTHTHVIEYANILVNSDAILALSPLVLLCVGGFVLSHCVDENGRTCGDGDCSHRDKESLFSSWNLEVIRVVI